MDSKLHIAKEDNHLRFTRLQIIKNLVVISCTFALLFSAYDGLSMLQSTMNGKQGIGSASQAVVYFTFAVSSLLLPKYTIKKLGCKMTLFVGTVLYFPYLVANLYPTWITMMSSAVLIGIGAGILWAAQCTYFNEAAGIYCKLVEDCKQGKKHRPIKSGESNFEFFVIQNGINEKMLSTPGLKSEGNILSNDYCEMLTKDSRADSKCYSVKIISENNQNDKQIMNNVEIQRQTELNTQNEKTHNMHVNQPTRTVSINSVNNEKYIADKEQLANTVNVNSELENSKDFLKYTEKENELTMDNLFSPDQCINKNMSFTNESLNNKIISENPSQFCAIESITARFFGCFGMTYYTAQVWSNLISYYVLNVNSEDNVTLVSNFSCGAGYCNSEFEVISGGTDEISPSTRYLLIGIAVALSVTSSLLLLIFLDPLDSGEDEEGVKFSLSHAMATLNHLRKKEQLFIIPLSMFSGLSQGFYTADFTKSYIKCGWSISYVGLVTVFFGLACGISSTLSGCAVRFVGRVPVVLLGLGLHLGIDVFLILWNPSTENHFMFYLAAALWGAKIGIFWSQIQAFYGLLFKSDEEAAFATHYFCSAMGWTISFAYSDYLCTSTKIYILMIMSCLGTLGYLAADRSYRRRNIQ